MILAKRDYSFESWMALADLLPVIRSERGVGVLECIFSDPAVLQALGWGKLFINANGAPPDDLLKMLKQGPGKHIKTNQCAPAAGLERAAPSRHAPLPRPPPPRAALRERGFAPHPLAQTATGRRSTPSSRASGASTRSRTARSPRCGPCSRPRWSGSSASSRG